MNRWPVRVVRVGQAAPPALAANGEITIGELKKSLRWTVILSAVIAGAAFAVGSGLVSRYVFPPHKRS